MEPVSTIAFIALAIVALTDAIKHLSPRVNGAVTIAVAVLVGVVVALLDTLIGLQDITVAAGVYSALVGSGIVSVAKRV